MKLSSIQDFKYNKKNTLFRIGVFIKDMTLIDHLKELRTRVIYSCLIVVVFFFVCFHFSTEISYFLLAPLKDQLADKGSIVVLGVLDQVMSLFQVSIWSALILSSPFLFYQVWGFIRPGLYPKEISGARLFLGLGMVLFFTGLICARFLIIPIVLETLMHIGLQDLESTINFRTFIIFMLKIMFFTGVGFQLPNIMLLLNFLGIVDATFFRTARRYVVLTFAILGAILTPPDVVTQLMILIPLVILYEIGIIGSVVFFKKKKENSQNEE